MHSRLPRKSGLAKRFISLVESLCVFALFGTLVNADDAFDKVVAPAIREHCAKCHGAGDEIDGDVNLLSLKSGNLNDNLELISKLIEVLDLGEMPPADQPELDPELRKQLVENLKSILQTSVVKSGTYPRAPIRRMNRFQYNNAVVDLFDLKCIVFTLPERMMRQHKKKYFQPATGKMANNVKVGSRPLGKSQMIEPRLLGVAAFPQDLRAENGFDNRGDHLSLSPLLMESFLRLGESITQSRDFVPKYVGVWNDFFKQPPEGVDAKAEVTRRLRPFLTKAFRRPVADDDLQRYSSFAHQQLDSGIAFTQVMKRVAGAAIASPKFLYLYDQPNEVTNGKAVEAAGDFDLASRLSFFLWGSIPDQRLLGLAESGELNKPEVLAAQVDQMLKHPKLKRFCDSFPAQWLQLERIISSSPNPETYKSFYFAKYRKSMHMMLEPLLVFETVLIEDLPITQLIDSDFTYRSHLLEDAYGSLGNKIKGKKKGGQVAQLDFYRVPVTDRRSGGVITNAAVMTMTSGPDRTQPITRGAWLAGVIFNNPPEPPPADVPPLDEESKDHTHLTLKERLAEHRKRSDCKGCHEQIDPLGFALENYNVVGKWREKYENDREVDMAGKLFNKHEFTNVVEFKNAILAEKDRFARGLAGHLLSFALARELSAADQIALDKIVQATAKDDYKMKTLIKQVVLSEPFLGKNNSAVEAK